MDTIYGQVKSSQSVYDSFNEFIFSNDIKVLGKLLWRFKFFESVIELPGDIVEVGVFKGSGVATFQKFIEIFCHNSFKRVIGFDIFDVNESEKILEKDSILDSCEMKKVYSRCKGNDLSFDAVTARLTSMNMGKATLVKGDVENSIPVFLKENPGFRISILYMDVDIERPTYKALSLLWDRILPGGIVIFDEYEYHKFSESSGVEKFIKERGIKFNVKSTNFMAPTAYLIKEEF